MKLFALVALLCAYAVFPASAQSPSASGTPAGAPPLTAAVESAGERADGGTSISVVLKNTGTKPLRFVPIEQRGVSPIIIAADAGSATGGYGGIEVCVSVPDTQQCLSNRDKPWTTLNPGEDILFVVGFTYAKYKPGRVSVTIRVVQELDGKQTIVPLQLRGITLP